MFRLAGSIAQDAAALFTLKSQPREVKSLAQRAEAGARTLPGRPRMLICGGTEEERRKQVDKEREGRQLYIPHESKAELPVQRNNGRVRRKQF